MELRPYSEFGHVDYKLLPFQFDRLDDGRVILINLTGEYCFVSERELHDLIDGKIEINGATFNKLISASFVYAPGCSYLLRAYSSKYKSRKSFLFGGPALHIFVLTLRCENSCTYCQVTHKQRNARQYDMSLEDARVAVERMFESPAPSLTVEFQGGEPLLAFDVLKTIVELCAKINQGKKKNIQFVVATSLQNINENMLAFFKEYQVHISTSLDGPEWLHNKNRPNDNKNSYRQTMQGIDLTRRRLGDDRVAGMTTITRASLSAVEEIVDEYVKTGFHSIFLRPLNMYGYAVKRENRIGYSSDEFNAFYYKALLYIINVNKNGYPLDEVNAALALNNILTPYATGYVDMRSPCGDGTGVLVYNYNGQVYPSDEARMLLEMGDNSLSLGNVQKPYKELLASEPMNLILSSGIAECIPGCADCAYLPYCGANPIQNYSRYGDMIGHRADNAFCKKQKYLYRSLFKLMDSDSNLEVFYGWLNNRPALSSEVVYE